MEIKKRMRRYSKEEEGGVRRSGKRKGGEEGRGGEGRWGK